MIICHVVERIDFDFDNSEIKGYQKMELKLNCHIFFLTMIHLMTSLNGQNVHRIW